MCALCSAPYIFPASHAFHCPMGPSQTLWRKIYTLTVGTLTRFIFIDFLLLFIIINRFHSNRVR